MGTRSCNRERQSELAAPVNQSSPTVHGGCVLLAATLLLAACGTGAADPQASGGRGARGGSTQVGYVVAQPTSVPLMTQLGGRVVASETSEVRPQVNGLIRARNFQEGSVVRKGQPLYRIDPSLYQAAVNQAQANVSSARATAEAADVKAGRYRPLVQMQAISKQDYTDAVAAAKQAHAGVAQNNAALRTAQINLHYTSIPAPISGRIGRSLATVGALVTANQADPLAVITRTDPIYVDMQQSAADLLSLKRAISTGGVMAGSTQVRLKLDDGSDYGFTGVAKFAEIITNESTGTVTLRAEFPIRRASCCQGCSSRRSSLNRWTPTCFSYPAGGAAGHWRGGLRLRRRRRQQGQAPRRRCNPHVRRQLGRQGRLEGRRQSDHSRDGEPQERSADPRSAAECPAKAGAAEAGCSRIQGGHRTRPCGGRRLSLVTDFHRPANFRLGHRDCHHARGAWGDLFAAD